MINAKLIKLGDEAFFETTEGIQIRTVILKDFMVKHVYTFQSIELGFSKIKDEKGSVYNILITNIVS